MSQFMVMIQAAPLKVRLNPHTDGNCPHRFKARSMTQIQKLGYCWFTVASP
jgi:hypothetical protein